MKIPPSSIIYPLHTLENQRPEFEPANKSHHWLSTIMNERPSPPPPARQEPSPSHKGSLAFILGPSNNDEDNQFYPSNSSCSSETESDQDERTVAPSTTARSPSQSKRRRVSVTQPASSRPGSPDKKGSKYCIVEGCTSRAKHARKCWRHGGSVKCKVADCINRAKSKGVCWSHGGGTICSHPQCETIAVSHGFCWAHGGGKRCQIEGCSRPAYERTNNFCTTHHKQNLRKQSIHP